MQRLITVRRFIGSFFIVVLWALGSIHAVAQDESDDEDFIILDDRGLGDVEEGDVPLSGRSAPIRRETASRDGSAGSSEPKEPLPPVEAPKRFEPSERISEDLSVSFPADI